MPQHPEPTPLRTVLSHLLLPVLMGAIMAAAYLGGFHKPDPHHLPVAVVGSAEQAGPVAAAIQQAVGDKADVTTLATRDEAESELRSQDIAGAYIPGQKKATLLTASAGSDTTANIVEKIFRAVADQQGTSLSVDDVVPVGDDDPAGQNGFFYLVALSVGSYAAAIAIGAAAATRRFRDRVALAAGTVVVLSTAYLAIAAWGFDMFSGHVWAMWELSLLYTAGVISVGVGLHPLLGRYCTLVYSAAFVAFNFTSSGGVFSPSLQPGLFGWLHDFWIGAGFIDAARVITYFPGSSLAGPMSILIGWLIFGVICLGIGFALQWRRQIAAQQVEETVRARVEEVVTAQHGRRSAARELTHVDGLDDDAEEELEENVAV